MKINKYIFDLIDYYHTLNLLFCFETLEDEPDDE